MCSVREVTNTRWGQRNHVAHAQIERENIKPSCTCALCTQKLNSPLRMRNSRKIDIPHWFFAVSNRTFHVQTQKVSSAAHAGGRFWLAWCLQHEPSSRLRLRSLPRSSTQVWALCFETRALREADISWFRHVASEKRAWSLSMRCVTLAARDSCAIFVSLAHRPVPPQRRGLWWTKWEKTASLRARDVL